MADARGGIVLPGHLALILLSAWAYAGCAEDLRPSTFTSGWTETPAAQPNDDPAEDEGLFPGVSNKPIEVYQDWRETHDPTMPCPEEMVLVADSYCVDRWEGSLVEITPTGTRRFPSNRRVNDHLVRAQSRPGTRPQGYISGPEAQRACEMAGKRLCTDWEWWRACAGSRKMIYPYGTMHVPRRCNEERPKHPVVELYGEDAGPEIWYVKPMNNPAINELPASLAVTGARHRCKSEDGLFDMVGNLHEWTSDPAGTFHGGAYSGKIALGCQYVTTAHGFSYHDYSTGFRCCSDPYGMLE